jgi:thiol-disulfide isomerase/thioredoxin
MFKKIALTLTFSSLLLFQGCSQEENQNQDVNSMLSKKSAQTDEYILTSSTNKQVIVKKSGNGFVLEHAEDKIVIFDIFATWCPPCRAEATHLTSLQKKYKGKLVVIGLTIEDNIPNEKIKKFQRKYNARYIIVNSSENRRLINDIATKLNVGERFPIPLMAMYKDGSLVTHYVGAVEEEFIESDIKKALGK